MSYCRFAGAVGLLCLSVGSLAFSQARSVSRIASSDEGYDPSSFGAPSVNDVGQVAFSASSADQSVTSVLRGSAAGGPLTVIADSNNPAVGNPGSNVSLNNSGQAAFWSRSPAGAEEGVFRGSGGAVTTIATTGPGYPFNFISVVVSQNDSGAVAFQAELDGPPFDEGLFTGAGGAAAPVFQTSTSQFTNAFASPSINRFGQIAFVSGTKAGPQGLFRYNPAIGNFTQIANDAGALGSFDDEPSLNNLGRVAFEASVDSPTGGEEAILVGDGTSDAAVFVTTENTPEFGSFNGQSINDAGAIAFIATSDDFSSQAIYLGPDPLTDRIIGTGDDLDGSTVASLRFFREGLNDKGEIAFAATLADGRGGIYLASPVPEPATGGLLLAALAAALPRRRRVA